jgi:hypothetical protein
MDDFSYFIINTDALESHKKRISGIINSLITKNSSPLYHYTSAAGIISILKSSELWFTKWNCLNDASEYKIVHSLIENCLSEFADDNDFVDLIRNYNSFELSTKNNGEIWNTEHNIFIASFSSAQDRLNMWNYYTKSAESDGYSIQFDNIAFQANKEHYSITVSSVIYDEIQQKELVKSLLHELYDSYQNKDLSQKGVDDRDMIMAHLYDLVVSNIGYLLKHAAFKDEEEVRALLYLEKDSENIIQYRASNGTIIPYIAVNFDKNSISEIMLSPSLANKNAIMGLRDFKNNQKCDFRISQSNIPFRNM